MTAEIPSLAGAGGGFTSQADQRAFAESVRTFSESVRKFADESRGSSTDALQPFVTGEKQTATANQLASGDYTAAMQGENRPQPVAPPVPVAAGVPPPVQQQRDAMVARSTRTREAKDDTANKLQTDTPFAPSASRAIPTDWESKPRVIPEGMPPIPQGSTQATREPMADPKSARSPLEQLAAPTPIPLNQPTGSQPTMQRQDKQATPPQQGFDAMRRPAQDVSMDMGNTFTSSTSGLNVNQPKKDQDSMIDRPMPVTLVGTHKLTMDARGDMTLSGPDAG